MDKLEIELLITTLNNKNLPGEVRASAAEALGEFKEKKVVDHLVFVLLEDSEVEVREAAAFALGEIGDRIAIEPLSGALKNQEEESEVRQAAAEALGRFGKYVLPLFLETLTNKDKDLRIYTISGLMYIDDDKAFTMLLAALNDEDDVRYAAISALGEIGDKRAIAPIIKLLDSEDSDIKFAAIIALGKLGSTEIIPILEGLETEGLPQTSWGDSIESVVIETINYIKQRE